MADFALITMICLLSTSPSTLIGVYDLSNSNNNNNYRNQLMQESQNQLMQESQNHKFLHQHQIQHHHHHHHHQQQQQQQQHLVVRQHHQSMCTNCDFTPDPSACHIKCSNGLNHPMLDISRQAAAMVAQQQQQQQIPNDEQQQQQSSQAAPSNAPTFVTTPMVIAAGTTNPTTASMISSPTTSTLSYTPSIGPPSGGKMNPHDVTFLLYTRYQRELFNELVQLNQLRSASVKLSLASVGHNSGTVSLIPSTASSAASSSISAASSANLVNGQVVGGGGQGGQTTGGGLSAQSLLEGLVSMSETIEINNDTSLNESHLNSSLPIKIIIHGFGSGGRRPWVTDMVHKLLDYEDVNVIVVDWEKGAALPNYVYAAGNTRIVGHRIATLIKSINAKHGLTGNRYHLIGFSLGAHVAGFAGMEIRNSTNISRNWINRITGLDPASPLFEGYEINDRLDPSDAQFVDVIHSNGDGVLRGGFGSLQPMGHVDFYPNGGRVQVGCNSVILSALSDIIYGKWQSLCNHRRALNFFMDSFEFSKCRFRSFNCDSYESYLRGDCFDCGPNNEKCSYMGYLANYSKGRGKMYLTTHEEAPFCANQFIIKIIGSKGYKTHWGKVEVTLVTLDGKHESFWLSSINSGQSSSSSGSSSSSTSSSTSPLSSSTISPSPSSTSSSSLVSSASSTSTLSPLASASSLTNPASLMSNVGSPLSSSNSQSGPSSSSSSINQDLLMGTSSISSSSSQSPSQRDQLNQQSMQSLIVAHPTLVNFTQVHLRYTKYKGWIYSGDENWPIDKVLITDSDGQVKSFCGYNTILESHITTRLNLEPGNCSVIEQPNSNTHAWMSEVM